MWKWSTLPGWFRGDPLLWRGDPPPRDASWLARVNEPLSAGDLKRPFGTDEWTRSAAVALGLESTRRGRGRPQKSY